MKCLGLQRLPNTYALTGSPRPFIFSTLTDYRYNSRCDNVLTMLVTTAEVLPEEEAFYEVSTLR
jgi:hypothetical protein